MALLLVVGRVAILQRFKNILAKYLSLANFIALEMYLYPVSISFANFGFIFCGCTMSWWSLSLGWILLLTVGLVTVTSHRLVAVLPSSTRRQGATSAAAAAAAMPTTTTTTAVFQPPLRGGGPPGELLKLAVAVELVRGNSFVRRF
jgi:hypothetical protein